jgi:hypothetical protein
MVHVDMGADEFTMPPVEFYFAKGGQNPIPGVTIPFDDANIYGWDGSNFHCVLSASQMGLPPEAKIRALVKNEDSFYISLDPSLTLTGIDEPVRSEDIVAYDITAGTWSLIFDGSDVLLDAPIDAFDVLDSNNVVISTEGNVRLPGLKGSQGGEDLLLCSGTFGPDTDCTWSVYLDGSDVNIRADVDGAFVTGGDIYLSTVEAFDLGKGPSAIPINPEDVFTCQGATTGEDSACTSMGVFFDGSVYGIVDNLTAISK